MAKPEQARPGSGKAPQLPSTVSWRAEECARRPFSRVILAATPRSLKAIQVRPFLSKESASLVRILSSGMALEGDVLDAGLVVARGGLGQRGEPDEQVADRGLLRADRRGGAGVLGAADDREGVGAVGRAAAQFHPGAGGADRDLGRDDGDRVAQVEEHTGAGLQAVEVGRVVRL